MSPSLRDGGFLLSWLEPLGSLYSLKYAEIKQGKVVKKGEVARGENWFVNWSDFPSVVQISDSFWLAHRLEKQKGGKTYDYDIVLSLSNDAGVTWRDIGSPHKDGSASEHGFAVIFPQDKAAGVVWLDGRDYFEKEDASKYPQKSGHFHLRYTKVFADGRMSAEQVIDDNTCTCCWPAVAMSARGPVVAWRGRTDAEMRDTRIASLRDGAWSKFQPLGAEGWQISGCPVNGPALAAQQHQVVAAWFTAEGNRPRVRAAFSDDDGQTFAKPIEIDADAPLGRISLLWLNERSAMIAWMQDADEKTKQTQLAMRMIHTDGTVGAIQSIVNVSAGRDTGVPQMQKLANNRLLLAWTNKAPQHGIKTLEVDLNAAATHLNKRVGSSNHTAPLPLTKLLMQPATFQASLCSNPH